MSLIVDGHFYFDERTYRNPLQDWEYVMRRKMQLIVPGIYLGPYAAAKKSQVCGLC